MRVSKNTWNRVKQASFVLSNSTKTDQIDSATKDLEAVVEKRNDLGQMILGWIFAVPTFSVMFAWLLLWLYVVANVGVWLWNHPFLYS